MSYQSQNQLANDVPFQHRITAVAVQQAKLTYEAGTPAEAALAHSVLRVEALAMPTFYSLAAASPGFDTDVDNGDGTIDSSKITDAQLLATIQAGWDEVAALFFDSTGAPI
jgi:hypothetical protein